MHGPEVVYRTPDGGPARGFVFLSFVLGAVLLTVATVLPASAARFTSTGRFVVAHRLELAVLGIALPLTAVLGSFVAK
jgi:hypothetical protein